MGFVIQFIADQCTSLRAPFLQIHSAYLSYRFTPRTLTPPPKSSLTAAAYVGSILRWRLTTTAASYDNGSVLRRRTTAVVIMTRRSTKRNANTGLLCRLPKQRGGTIELNVT